MIKNMVISLNQKRKLCKSSLERLELGLRKKADLKGHRET
jgi:hypothetical protein